MDSLLKLIFSIIGTIGLIATVGGCVYALVNPRIRAVVKVAWKAAFRFRVFWVMAVLLVVSVGVIPLIVKGDGTAEGLTQVLVTYTLTMITAVLATGVLWLSVGTLARDIGESHIQMIAVKPIARWQIILGKWVGVMSLNLLLLAVGGAVVYGLVEYRANKLTWDRLEELEPRSDLEIAQMALETGRQIFVLEEEEDGRIVGVQPTKKDQPLLSELAQSEIGRGNNLPNLLARYRQDYDGQTPLLRDIQEVREEVASNEEDALRTRVLVGRANFALEDVLYSLSPEVNRPLDEKYTDEMEGLLKQMREEFIVQRVEAIEQSGGTVEEQDLVVSLKDEQLLKNRARLIHRIYAQVMKPETGFLFRFKKPLGYDLDEEADLHLQFKFEDPKLSYSTDNRYDIHVLAVPGEVERMMEHGLVMNKPYLLKARMEHKIAVPSKVYRSGEDGGAMSVFGEEDYLNIIIRNPIPDLTNNVSIASMKIPFLDEDTGEVNPASVQLLYRESGFAVNYARSLGIIFAWLGVLCALGLLASSFMSFSMGTFACIGVLLAASATGLMKDVIKDETIMQTYTGAQRDSSVVDWYALPAFKVLVGLISPMKDFSPIENLANGKSITWSEMGRAYFYNWGCAVFLLGGLGSVIFSRRQLAITGVNSQ